MRNRFLPPFSICRFAAAGFSSVSRVYARLRFGHKRANIRINSRTTKFIGLFLVVYRIFALPATRRLHIRTMSAHPCRQHMSARIAPSRHPFGCRPVAVGSHADLSIVAAKRGLRPLSLHAPSTSSPPCNPQARAIAGNPHPNAALARSPATGKLPFATALSPTLRLHCTGSGTRIRPDLSEKPLAIRHPPTAISSFQGFDTFQIRPSAPERAQKSTILFRTVNFECVRRRGLRIHSLLPLRRTYYQLAFVTPGIKPLEAISRNWIRLMPNRRI